MEATLVILIMLGIAIAIWYLLVISDTRQRSARWMYFDRQVGRYLEFGSEEDYRKIRQINDSNRLRKKPRERTHFFEGLTTEEEKQAYAIERFISSIEGGRNVRDF